MELLRAQERLELAHAVARIGTWDIDLATGETVWSQSMGQMLGVGDAPAANDLFLSLAHPDDRDRIDREFAKALDHGGDELS